MEWKYLLIKEKCVFESLLDLQLALNLIRMGLSRIKTQGRLGYFEIALRPKFRRRGLF